MPYLQFDESPIFLHCWLRKRWTQPLRLLYSLGVFLPLSQSSLENCTVPLQAEQPESKFPKVKLSQIRYVDFRKISSFRLFFVGSASRLPPFITAAA
jgi:hypothetical protein